MKTKYKLKNNKILKDGHTMFLEDVVYDLNCYVGRIEKLEKDKSCALYVDYKESCQALKDHIKINKDMMIY